MSLFYLYVKTHNITKLNYLGFTIQNPFRYKGSGKYWLAHLKRHGGDISTRIIFETDDYNEIQTMGLFFSTLFDVVKSNNWANLKPEHGDSGYGHTHSDETKEKLRVISSGRKHTESAKEKCRLAKLGKKQSSEHLAKLSKVRKGKTPHNKGKPSPFIGIPRPAECKKNIKHGIIEMCKIPRVCPHCGKEGHGNAMKRWHFDNCKYRSNI